MPIATNLVIDWGNTSLKAGWFEHDMLVETNRYPNPEALLDRLTSHPVAYAIIASTGRPAEEIKERLAGINAGLIVFDSYMPIPLRKAYDTPTTLGADRVAAAAGAITLFPAQDCLILDLGTCLTADLVDRDAVFQGGLISPGLRMRFRAMHEQTARLPLVDTPTDWSGLDWPDLTAKNTQAALQSGVMNGLAFELAGIVESYRRERPDLVVLLCGGDAPAFESRIKPPIFVVPELVLMGLNRILRYNVKDIQANTPAITT